MTEPEDTNTRLELTPRSTLISVGLACTLGLVLVGATWTASNTMNDNRRTIDALTLRLADIDKRLSVLEHKPDFVETWGIQEQYMQAETFRAMNPEIKVPDVFETRKRAGQNR